MATEIERRFLVNDNIANVLHSNDSKSIIQGYLSRDPNKTIRVRLVGDNEAFITIKGKKVGASAPEYEYEIPRNDAEDLLEICDEHVIYKLRINVDRWEIDTFYRENFGLIIAEIELESEDEEFEKPEWLGEEITANHKYSNANLSENPFCNWSEE